MNTSGHPGEIVLSPDECMALLGSRSVGRLVTSTAELHIRPVNYMLRGTTILIRTATPIGHADEVLFEVDEIDESHKRAWSVIARGPASTGLIVETADESIELPEPWVAGATWYLISIEVTSITGRCISAARPDGPADLRGYL
jgi:hypothetical protein